MAQHISVRVPWHDNGWNGFVCNNPDRNQACRVLKNIALKRADINVPQCVEHTCKKLTNTDEFVPPCVTESGHFMSEHIVKSMRSHPYTYHESFTHILDTELNIEPYSFIGIPFNWTLKDKLKDGDSPNSRFFTGFDQSIELDVSKNNSWVSNGINQKRVFDYFYRNVKSKESIIVAYSKAVPFIENPGRIVMGIGYVESVDEPREYNYSTPPVGKLVTAHLWERSIKHSIRCDRSNGFLFPFVEIQSYLENNPQQNPDDLVVFAPEEYIDEFSYATEHLSHDALIQTLNRTITVLKKYKDIKLPYRNGANWDDCIEWCQAQLYKIWDDRGVYPGLGAVLSALGVPFGFDVANTFKSQYNDDILWDNLADGIDKLSSLLSNEQKDILRGFTTSQREDIADEVDAQKDYLKLLSRITLSLPQAMLLLDQKTRSSGKLCYYADFLTDIQNKDLSKDIIENPYLLYEKTYQLESKYQIGISKIDLAMFPPEFMKKRFFSTDDEYIFEPDDKRRLRAIIVSVLEREAGESGSGSSLMLISDVINNVGKFRSDVPDIEPSIRLKSIQNERRKSFFDKMFSQLQIRVIPDSGDERDETAVQLVRLQKVSGVIQSFIEERVDGFIDIQDDWEKHLATVLGGEQQSEEDREKAAREEKVSAIRKMATSHISVLTGGAGTGKTTTLAALCLSDAIQDGGILVMAPTGKARVVLSSKLNKYEIKHNAKTLFQFLQNTNHCDTNTWSYYLSGKLDNETPATVIIDECSMMTEEMFGAFLEAIRKAKRVIFVGDPNQLPPIGTGKPFYELVQKMKEQTGQPHYATLLISNRQKEGDTLARRLDVELAKMFTEDLASCVGDDLFERIADDTDNIEFIKCDDVGNLPNAIESVFEKIGITDVNSFDELLGGEIDSKWGMSFTNVKSVENWQVLSPYKNKEIMGTRSINASIQQQYRLSCPGKRKETYSPLGSDGILYGEKVINVKNHNRSSERWAWSVWSPIHSMGDCDYYIANGEIGIVSKLKRDAQNRYKENKSDYKDKYHIVEFSSQSGYEYKFHSGVSEDDSQLELAYALTVHKAQGSGFNATIFILLEAEKGINPLITREMLYTALTRQSDKVFIVYNKHPYEIAKYRDVELSDLAHRKTNLFGNTILRQVKNGWYDSKNVFITKDGTRVKSKSEMIVYHMLLEAKKSPIYEQELRLGEITVHPDFTIETAHGTVYWEHLGMLGDYNYRKDWERKKKLYEEHEITEENGMLVISQDELNGALEADKIQELINRLG